MNYYEVFYWVTRADSVKNVLDSFSNIFTFMTVIFFLGAVIMAVCKSMVDSELADKVVAANKDSTNNNKYDKKRPLRLRPRLLMARTDSANEAQSMLNKPLRTRPSNISRVNDILSVCTVVF